MKHNKLRLAGEAVGTAAILVDSYETRQKIVEALARGDVRAADREMGGLIGRSFGGAFGGALLGAELGSALGPAGAIGGAILGGIIGGIGGGELGKWLGGEMHDSGFNGMIRGLLRWLHDVFSDPLVLDLDGDGIELVALASSTTCFDLDGDGVAERTGWVSPHDGLLVQDSNGNGLVDGIGELFGSAHVDGYDELRTLDYNGDGKVDAADPAFAQLLVWRDLNSDGISTPDEILTLAQAGIQGFNLGFSQVDQDVAGNVVARTGLYIRLDGTSRAAASVRFALDESAGRQVIPEGADLGDLPLLPDLPASAAMADLRTAMFFDPLLKTMVEDLARGPQDFETFQEFADGGFIAILYRWAGVDVSVPEDPANPYYIKVFEALTGLPIVGLNEFQQDRVADAWPELVKQLGMLFLVQAEYLPRLEPFYDMVEQAELLDPNSPTYLESLIDLVEGSAASRRSESRDLAKQSASFLTMPRNISGRSGRLGPILCLESCAWTPSGFCLHNGLGCAFAVA